ncbi:hypothetical protein [Methylobacterium pseudosasicola]|uniref:Stability determinant domain-containing protein n=1 Tax=Methylobacterium pseudosasicola TaxID=582667 RepID=A0A1I4KGU0_9HYPH|nr:hypothetical protein [Methylobacterium pseudosasicola]SFL77686.1 hypothetical protein SAMN05192568_1010103 [Methylobacterium pseudosasicola]
MRSMTIEQLRATNVAGGVAGVTLKGEGGTFLVEIATRSGTAAVLAKARSTEPRRFGNPLAALNVLRGVGITIGRFDASDWDPSETSQAPGNRGRAEAMRKAHRAAADADWLAAEIQDSLDDPRPNLSHDALMDELRDDLAELEGGAGRT